MKQIRIALIGIGVLGFILTMYAVMTVDITNIDRTVSAWFYSIRTPGLNTLTEAITYLGNWEAIVIICIILLLKPNTRVIYGLPVAVAAISTSIIKMIIKPIVARPRPELMPHLIEQGGYSFPSGHAITSFAVYGLLFILILRYMENTQKKVALSILCGALAILIGLSRIYVGVHFVTDVIAGWSAAVACLSAILLIIDYMNSNGMNAKLEEKIGEK